MSTSNQRDNEQSTTGILIRDLCEATVSVDFNIDSVPLPVKIVSFVGPPSMNVYDWLYNFETTTAQANWDDNRRFERIPLFFDEKVKSWYQYVRSDVSNFPRNWEDFKSLFIACFPPANHQDFYSLLYNTKQEEGEDVVAYCTEMLHYSVKCNIQFEKFLEICINGLDIHIQAELQNIETIKTYPELIKNVRNAEKQYMFRRNNLCNWLLEMSSRLINKRKESLKSHKKWLLLCGK
uniref:Retrotransposon gag domain-containing protein n=1 Tax=Tetranychus urticae TaxID=32264 RepID=T1JSS7_TETUR